MAGSAWTLCDLQVRDQHILLAGEHIVVVFDQGCVVVDPGQGTIAVDKVVVNVVVLLVV